MTVTITDPEQIKLFQMKTIRASIRLEIIGLRRANGSSATEIARKKYGIKAKRRVQVMEELDKLIETTEQGDGK